MTKTAKNKTKKEVLRRLKLRIECLQERMELEMEYSADEFTREINEQISLAKIYEVENIIKEIEEYI